jgi:hypothetical protein
MTMSSVVAENVDTHLQRVRSVCLALPEVTERLSHGEPTFFVRKKVFAMFANDHHGDGRIAVWLPMPLGLQELLVAGDPATFFKPPYVGVRGWVGIELAHISNEDLSSYLHEAWSIRAPKRLRLLAQARGVLVDF